jgi:glycosyltransferase involved in cell wall biosynthesis
LNCLPDNSEGCDLPESPAVRSVASGRVVVSINTSWNIVNFRAGLVSALRSHGFEIVAASPVDAHTARLPGLGCRHVPLAMDNKGTNPLKDIGLFLRYLRLMRSERPDVYLGWTIKPNIYGSLAARLFGIPCINNVSGLGTAFLRDGWLTRVARLLYRTALNRSVCVFFQNRDDRDLFVGARLVRAEQARLLPGSGVDLGRFAPAPPAPRPADEGPVFILVARLLWDKGVGEYVKAARRVKARAPQARFRLLGFLDVENRTAVPRETVEGWEREGLIDYLGATDDVRPHIADADCVVLPSYREGTPRSLLEAAAMARPLIATDVPGCREVVDDGVNGWLCRARDAEDLADRMLRFVDSSEERRIEMGRQSRLKAERQFDEHVVFDAYLDAIKCALEQRTKTE